MSEMLAGLFRLLRSRRFTRSIMPALSLAYTIVYISAPIPQPAWAAGLGQPAWTTVIGLIGVMCSILLWWSSAIPFTVITIESIIYIVLSLLTMDESFLIPLMAALYTCVSLPPAKYAIAGVADAVTAVSVVALLLHRHDMLIIEWAARMAAVAVVVAIALTVRAYRVWRETTMRQERARARARILIRQRDQAASRARIAGELHDSVGHDLTTIIALSQGFAGSHDLSELHEVLVEINQIAREGLNDTRQAVHALASDHHTSDGPDPQPMLQTTEGRLKRGITLHRWDEIEPVLAHARAVGLAAVLTETGRRRDDPEQANLCFAVSREAVTNILRHAMRPSMIVVSWDHRQDGTVHVNIHDDGRPASSTPLELAASESTGRPGTGLGRLSAACIRVGGVLRYGPDANGGWSVEATIPANSDPHRLDGALGGAECSTSARKGDRHD